MLTRRKDKLTLKTLLAAFAFSGMLWVGFIAFCLAIVEVAEGHEYPVEHAHLKDTDGFVYISTPSYPDYGITECLDMLKEAEEELASCQSQLDSIDESGFDNRTNN